MTDAFHIMYTAVLGVIGILLLCCLIRAIKGPRIADRIIAINMMGTMVIIAICVLAFLLHEGYLVDVSIIYAMLSFLAVVLLTKIYIGVYRQHHTAKQEDNAESAPEEMK